CSSDLAHRARGVDSRPQGLVGEADEIRIREAIPENWQIRTLAVREVQDFRSFVMLVLLDDLLRPLALLVGLVAQDLEVGIAQRADRYAVGRIGHHSR